MSGPQQEVGRDTPESSETQRDIIKPETASRGSRADGSNQPLYFPLVEAEIIRLVELAPGARGDPVVIKLFIAELEHHPEYEALSYVWGNPEHTVPILCNGRTLDITSNLNAAFRRVRHSDRPRIVWADAVCINQMNLEERSHHVSFMGRIYRHASRVLVCLGVDSDGGAEDVAALVKENADLVSRYSSIMEMPVLAPDDSLFDDSRWKALASLMKSAWFTRAWVLQEVGLAKEPRVLYGDVEFSYRELMTLAQWVVRCAPNLDPRASVSFYSIHTDWLDWSPDWRQSAMYPKATFLDLMNHARWLGCRERRDHIYAFLGHPLARLDDGDRTIVKPDYLEKEEDVFLELTVQLIKKNGLRVLSSVEHDDQTLNEAFPSWIPFRWDVEYVMCTLGVYTDFYYAASAGAPHHPPTVVDQKYLEVQGMTVDIVTKTYQFTAPDLVDPATLKTSPRMRPQQGMLDQIWADVQDGATACAYAERERLDAFSLTLRAGLSAYQSAEEDLDRHGSDFAAYWGLRNHSSTSHGAPLAGLQEVGQRSDPEKFWLDMRLVCEGRTFLLTRNGYYGIGPYIAKPGDVCCVLFGATVPFILRKADAIEHYQLVGEAYLHGLMRGEAVTIYQKDEQREKFVLC